MLSPSQGARKSRLFVLDTNVLMHDPTALFRFHEHDIFLPMVVLEELDRGKKGVSEVARNVRQVSRFLDQLMANAPREQINQGLPLSSLLENGDHPATPASGRLFFQTRHLTNLLPESLPGDTPDNNILAVALALREEHLDRVVILVSKDINLRIKAAVLGIRAEDYSSDQALDDLNLLYTGALGLPADFWSRHVKEVTSWKKDGRTYYRITGPEVAAWYPNQCLYLEDDSSFEAMVRGKPAPDQAVVELVDDYRGARHSVWGIKARNREQNFAFNMLMDPALDFVSLLGTAGTGKTLLALAAGLTLVLDRNQYREIIMTRVTVPVGEDIGFLPGTEEEKMTPWMGALEDNLEVLNKPAETPAGGPAAGAGSYGGDWGRAATMDLIRNRIKIKSLNFMRGRTFMNKFLIIDEAQNLTPKQMKTLITRAGPGTKVVCLGNIAQIDTPYLTEGSSGLTYVVDRFKGWGHSGHVTLQRGERSRLAEHAAEVL